MEKNILIVEDDQFLRELIGQKLVAKGYNVIEAEDGRKAIKEIKRQKLNLILLDLILPDIDGFEVLAHIKKDSALSEIPVIILSNLGQKDDIEKGLKMGARDYLIKAQFTPEEVVEKIKAIIG